LLIAFLPTYAMIGWVAPLLLCVLRFGQGLGLGGEWGGAALLAVENAPKGWEARFGAAPQLGAPVGFLAANGLFLLLGLGLSDADFAAWGWRVPFLASAVLVGIGLWVRLRIGETAAYKAALEHELPPPVPLARVFSRHFGPALAGTAGVVACFAIFYLSTAYALAQGTGPLGHSRQAFLGVQLAANCFLALGIVLAAVASDRASPRTVLAWGAAGTVLLGLVFGPGLAAGSLWTVFATLALALTVMGFVYGPLGSWLPTLFPVPVRYSAISFAFNFGGILGGAITPILAQLMAAEGFGPQVGLLISMAGALSLAGVLLARPFRA
jgi:Sugar (and other) transporter